MKTDKETSGVDRPLDHYGSGEPGLRRVDDTGSYAAVSEGGQAR